MAADSSEDFSPKPTAHEVVPGCSLDRRSFLTRAGVAGAGLAAASSPAMADDGWQDCGGADDVGDWDRSARCVVLDYGKATYDNVTSLISSGYDKEDVHEMVAENQYLEIYESFENADRLLHGYHVETENWSVPSDPDQSALMDIVYGEAEAQLFRDIEADEHSQTEMVDRAMETAREQLSIPAKNYARQWNEWIWIIFRHLATFSSTSASGGEYDFVNDEYPDDEPRHSNLNATDEGLEPEDVFFMRGTSSDISELTPYTVENTTWTLPNGENQPIIYLSHETTVTREWDPLPDSDSWGYETGMTLRGEGRGVVDDIELGDDIEIIPDDPDESEWVEKFDLIDHIEEWEMEDLEAYLESVLGAVSRDEIEPIEILGPAEYARQFGDSDDIRRLDAQMHALGLQSPEEGRTNVTLSWTDDDGEERTETGSFYVSWNWDEMNEWEYEYDADSLTLELDSNSIMEHTIYEAQFENGSEEFIVDDLDDDYSITFEDDHGALESIDLDAEGNLNSSIPVGETFTVDENGDADMVYLGYDDDDGYFTRESISGEVTIDDADDDDDHVTLTGFNQRTRDPARAIDRALYYEEQRKSTEDLEDSEVSLPGIPGLSGLGDGAGLLGLGLIGVVILAVIGIVTDLIPGLGD